MSDARDTNRPPRGPAVNPDMTGASSSSASREIERDAAATRQAAKETVEAVKEKTADLGDETKKAAREVANDVKEQARSFAEEQKDEAAGRVVGVADALRSAASDLDGRDQSAMAGYAREAASGLDQVAAALSNRNLDDLVETVEDFARRQPIAFLGGAALAGFVMAHFAKSSADRRRADARRRYERPRGDFSRDSGGYNPVGMAPEGQASHRFPGQEIG